MPFPRPPSGSWAYVGPDTPRVRALNRQWPAGTRLLSLRRTTGFEFAAWQLGDGWGLNVFYRQTHAGLPFGALNATWIKEDSSDPSFKARVLTRGWDHGVRLPAAIRKPQPLPDLFESHVPVVPLWPGFALDTAFYGAIVLLLWSAPGVLRRRTRKRRGRCPACGYDLRGLARCPECGGTMGAAAPR
jgi:hypothetical protein